MTRPLGTAPSIPRHHASLGSEKRGAADPIVRGGGAAPNDWATAWLALANRIAGWRQAREPEDQQTLIFDNYDQARLA